MAQPNNNTTLSGNAKPSPFIPYTDEDHARDQAKQTPFRAALGALAMRQIDKVTPALVDIVRRHLDAYIERDMLREVPIGNEGHDEWKSEVERLDHAESEALIKIATFPTRAPFDNAYRAAYLWQLDIRSDVFSNSEFGPALLKSLVDAGNPSDSQMLAAAIEAPMDLPEIRMSWLVRAFRDAAMLIDPTIVGCWVGENGDLPGDVAEGATRVHSVAFDRKSAGMVRTADDPKVTLRYLPSERLEPLDLDEMTLDDLTSVCDRMLELRDAVTRVTEARVFRVVYTEGPFKGAYDLTPNGERIDAITEWAAEQHQRAMDLIANWTPATVNEARERAYALLGWEVLCGGDLTDMKTIIGTALDQEQQAQRQKAA